MFLANVSDHLAGKNCKHCTIGNSSKKEQKWLDFCEVPNDSKHRNVRIKISGKIFIVDGLLSEYKMIYEFLGDFWHGHPVKFPHSFNKVNKTEYSKLFNLTINRIKLFRQHGYKVICIWESRFNKMVKLGKIK